VTHGHSCARTATLARVTLSTELPRWEAWIQPTRRPDLLVAKVAPGPGHDAGSRSRRCMACMMCPGVRRREHTGGTRYPTASMPFSRGKAYTSTTPWESAAVHRCAWSRPEQQWNCRVRLLCWPRGLAALGRRRASSLRCGPRRRCPCTDAAVSGVRQSRGWRRRWRDHDQWAVSSPLGVASDDRGCAFARCVVCDEPPPRVPF
jgi:hypothetical protein